MDFALTFIHPIKLMIRTDREVTVYTKHMSSFPLSRFAGPNVVRYAICFEMAIIHGAGLIKQHHLQMIKH